MGFVSHFVSEDEITRGKATEDLSFDPGPARQEHQEGEGELRIPHQYFLIRLPSPQLGKIIGGDDPAVMAVIRDVNTGILAQGRCNSEIPDEPFFLLVSEKGEEVVREGDQLQFELTDRQGNTFLSLAFPVLKEDVEEFSKTVAVEFLEHLLQWKTKSDLGGEAQMIAKETGSTQPPQVEAIEGAA